VQDLIWLLLVVGPPYASLARGRVRAGSCGLRVPASRVLVGIAEAAAGVGDADGASDAAVDAIGDAAAVRQAGAGALHELSPEAGVSTARCCSRHDLMRIHGGDSASMAD
jgi:hypothetical protein